MIHRILVCGAISISALGNEIDIGHGSDDGHVLLGELKCAACHDPGKAGSHLLQKNAPKLGNAGARLNPEWKGAFISAKPAWDGRAGQYTTIPSNDRHEFPEGPPFAQLEDSNAPWLTDLGKQKRGSARTPDGWRFRGYQTGKGGTPTFHDQISDGFNLTFTQSADPKSLADVASYSARCWMYHYHSGYGDNPRDERILKITRAEPSADGTSVRLRIAGLVPHHLHAIRADGLRSRGGLPLLHPDGYYTLNRIPKS